MGRRRSERVGERKGITSSSFMVFYGERKIPFYVFGGKHANNKSLTLNKKYSMYYVTVCCIHSLAKFLTTHTVVG